MDRSIDRAKQKKNERRRKRGKAFAKQDSINKSLRNFNFNNNKELAASLISLRLARSFVFDFTRDRKDRRRWLSEIKNKSSEVLSAHSGVFTPHIRNHQNATRHALLRQTVDKAFCPTSCGVRCEKAGRKRRCLLYCNNMLWEM
ncbi:hypothetical protein O6H91_02G050300 [Diphasiastrum complanatum]|uniref:Uncharacterized protein n=1 Tax=Diphasiastrum complanatum TaxID=34168 RepID=A0ACC2EF98_DIPCM|nr:hypothetical protein O6H91_02G050300 [Diphasiastrum complanatum]